VKIDTVNLLAKFSSEGYNKILINGAKGLLRLLCFEPGQSVPLHRHPRGDEYFYIVKGKGKITVGKEEAEANSGCIFKVPAGVLHGWENESQRLILLSIIIPAQSYELSEEAVKMEFV